MCASGNASPHPSRCASHLPHTGKALGATLRVSAPPVGVSAFSGIWKKRRKASHTNGFSRREGALEIFVSALLYS
nr:MAG TPA: hypothetical protein [Caudoviricetes sp.]